jgi:hypothetical protein
MMKLKCLSEAWPWRKIRTSSRLIFEIELRHLPRLFDGLGLPQTAMLNSFHEPRRRSTRREQQQFKINGLLAELRLKLIELLKDADIVGIFLRISRRPENPLIYRCSIIGRKKEGKRRRN